MRSPIFACHVYPRHPLPLLRPRRRALHQATRSVPPHVRKVQVLQPVELPHLGARRGQQLDELARSLPRLGQIVGRLAPLRAACLEVLHPARQLLVPTLERGAPEQLDHIPGTACAVAAPQRGAPAHTHTPHPAGARDAGRGALVSPLAAVVGAIHVRLLEKKRQPHEQPRLVVDSVEHPQLWDGLRRATGATASFRAAEAALWGR